MQKESVCNIGWGKKNYEREKGGENELREGSQHPRHVRSPPTFQPWLRLWYRVWLITASANRHNVRYRPHNTRHSPNPVTELF